MSFGLRKTAIRTEFQMSYVADYYAYGKVLRSYTAGNTTADRYPTTGHERDDETGFDYRGARFYDGEIGRFLSLDPLAAKFAAWSPYNYVLGNPIAFVDEDGKAPSDWIRNLQTNQWHWDKNITSAAQTPSGYEYAAPGHPYTAANGQEVMLGDNGNWSYTGNINQQGMVIDEGYSSQANATAAAGARAANFGNTLANFTSGAFTGIVGVLSAGSSSFLTGGMINGGQSATINFAGQFAESKKLSKVDFLSVGFAFGGGFIRNATASTVITGSLDAGFDYTTSKGLQMLGKDKSNMAVFGDLVFNVGLGMVSNGYKQQLPEAKNSAAMLDFLTQYFNGKASSSIPE